MKKVIMTLAIVCTVAFANAAALNWATWGWSGNSNSDEGNWFTGGQAYLVMVEDTTTFSVADNLSITGGKIVDSAAIADGSANGLWNGTDALVDGTTYQFAMILTDSGEGFSVPESGLYGVDTNDGAFYNITWNTLTGGLFEPTHDGIYVNNTVSGVPEPTSGLLLLVGGALLALRRKQK